MLLVSKVPWVLNLRRKFAASGAVQSPAGLEKTGGYHANVGLLLATLGVLVLGGACQVSRTV